MESNKSFDTASDTQTADLVAQYMNRFFGNNDAGYRRFQENIWKIYEAEFNFDLILTSKLVIYDAMLFDELPDNQLEFFTALLSLNTHRTKGAKLCVDGKHVLLRIIRGHEEYPYSEFEANINEFRHLFYDLRVELMTQFYKNDSAPHS